MCEEYIPVCQIPKVKNFRPYKYFFGVKVYEHKYYIACHYMFTSNDKDVYGSFVIAFTKIDYGKTHKIVGLTEDCKYIKIRKIRVV